MDARIPLVSTAATRRTVVAAGVATVATVAAPDVAEAARAPRRSRFDKLVGETFVATRDGRRVALRLDAVQDAPYRPPGLRGERLARWRRQSYVLVFTTRGVVEQGTWSLRARRSRRFRLFVVPGADRGRRTVVTATFNGWRG
ncbi:hypothetical protein [Nocardioides sp. SYSU D00065]|uniref:DUF6916 family protein n=1 Tax=Nocardioides sp. SYSU D00065 TaxID=2817378 RepID=UPI001B337508|nr:hypothetical protein [Nocardioides sp. SYSU D00065]